MHQANSQRVMHHQTLLLSQQANRPGLAVCPRQRPARPCTRTRAAGRNDSSSSSEGSGPSTSFSDPEAKFRRYGRYFGGGFRLDLDTWFQVPRVRIRQTAQRQKDELLELAVLNERLAGTMAPWQARNRLEQLRMRRRNWEAIYDYVTRTDAAATLALIEEANKKAEQLLSEEESERASVTDLRERLTDLQSQVDQASQRLNMTQKRVEHNLQRVNELKAEAAALERLKETVTAEPVYASSSSSAAPAARATSTVNSRTSSTTTTSRASSSSNSSSSMATMTAPPAPAAARQQTGQPSEQQRQQEQQQQRRRSMADRRRDRGLSSSLEIEEGLREFWYPAEFSSRLKTDVMVPFELLGQPWVLFRDEHGRPACVRDECAHRACPLSLGKVIDGKVSCAYHGWEFNGAGECTKMPSTMQCSHIGVAALPCAEKDGFVWVWPGLGAPPEVPSSLAAPEGFEVHSEIVIDVPVEHGLLMENLLDLAHAPFTHTTTFARGWPIPDVVKFHAQQLLSGSWDPYPIDMAFQPPCSVLSRVGLAQPGKIMRGVRADACERHLHQLHVCAPAKKGHTRLLYRMSLDFMPWAKHVPFVDKLWRKVADQVLGEDLVLVLGQQDRLSRGGDTWANPVSYDKLAVRYRRWRNAVAAEGRGSGPQAADALVSMSAGELFAPTESMDGQGECWTGDESDAEQECSVDGPSPLQEARQLVVAAAAGAGAPPSAAVEAA